MARHGWKTWKTTWGDASFGRWNHFTESLITSQAIPLRKSSSFALQPRENPLDWRISPTQCLDCTVSAARFVLSAIVVTDSSAERNSRYFTIGAVSSFRHASLRSPTERVGASGSYVFLGHHRKSAGPAVVARESAQFTVVPT